ncbi:MAG: hypothetical protein Q9174_007054 [Haloplaca sp. 1 TL-2023]
MPHEKKSHGETSTSPHSNWLSKHFHKDKAEPEPIAKSPFYWGPEFQRIAACEQEVEKQRLEEAGLPPLVIKKMLMDRNRQLEKLENEEWKLEEEERHSKFAVYGYGDDARTRCALYENASLSRREESRARNDDMKLLRSGVSCREILERKMEARLGKATKMAGGA